MWLTRVIEVTASSLYEAVAQGLRIFRQNEWVDEVRHARPFGSFINEDCDTSEQYDWPGNVRELQNIIECALILAESGGWLTLDLAFAYSGSESVSVDVHATLASNSSSAKILRSDLKHLERNSVVAALESAH
jgi:transcriptional regulator with PAS, ATPase and Fis domain